jgi:hypothetical protein
LRRLAALALACCHGVAAAQFQSDWELEQERRNWKEREVQLPAYPEPENLIEFYVSAVTDFRFFVDRPSISVGPDGVVRYTLVARSSSGAENVSYEGIRCLAGTYRVYAYAKAGGAWSQRESAWRPIEQKALQRHHHALWQEFFCPHRAPIANAAEGRDALARGGHRNAGGGPATSGGKY